MDQLIAVEPVHPDQETFPVDTIIVWKHARFRYPYRVGRITCYQPRLEAVMVTNENGTPFSYALTDVLVLGVIKDSSTKG